MPDGRPWRFVVIGCGRMGDAHSRRLANDDRAQLIGLYDADESAAIKLRNQFANDATVFASIDQALAAEADAVVIATPTDCHHDQVSAALSAGRHVLAEKPLAGTRSEIVRILKVAEAHPHLHCVLGYQRRFWRNDRYLREELSSGKRGRLRAVTCVICERWEAGIVGTWRDDPAVNYGGFLGDAGSHKIDAMMYVTGLQPRRLYAESQRSRSQVEIMTSVTGTLQGDLPLTMTFIGNAHSYYEELLLHCDAADLILRDERVLIAQNNDVRPVDLPANQSGDRSVANPITGFLDVLNGITSNPAPFSCALPVFDVTAAILQSARDGQPVEL